MAGVRFLHWNGKDVPDELRELPAGTYVVEAVDDAPSLTNDEEQVSSKPWPRCGQAAAVPLSMSVRRSTRSFAGDDLLRAGNGGGPRGDRRLSRRTESDGHCGARQAIFAIYFSPEAEADFVAG
jgi:hypothetical protein